MHTIELDFFSAPHTHTASSTHASLLALGHRVQIVEAPHDTSLPAKTTEYVLDSDDSNRVRHELARSRMPCDVNMVLNYEAKNGRSFVLGNIQYEMGMDGVASEAVLDDRLWWFHPRSQTYRRHPCTVISLKSPSGISVKELDLTNCTGATGVCRTRWGNLFHPSPVQSMGGVPSTHWNPSTLSCWLPITSGYMVDARTAYAGSETTDDFLMSTVEANMIRAFDLLGAAPGPSRDFSSLTPGEKRMVLAMTIQGVFPYYVSETAISPQFYSRDGPNDIVSTPVDPRDRSQQNKGTNGDCDDAMIETFLFATSLFELARRQHPGVTPHRPAAELLSFMRSNFDEPLMVVGLARTPSKGPDSRQFCHAYTCLADKTLKSELGEVGALAKGQSDVNLGRLFRLIPSQLSPVPHMDRESEQGYTAFTTRVNQLRLSPLVVPDADAVVSRAEPQSYDSQPLPPGGKPLLIEATAPTVPDLDQFVPPATRSRFPGIRDRLLYNDLVKSAGKAIKRQHKKTSRAQDINVFCGARVTEDWNYGTCHYVVGASSWWKLDRPLQSL